MNDMPKLAFCCGYGRDCVLTELTRFIYHVKFCYGSKAINLSHVTKQLAI